MSCMAAPSRGRLTDLAKNSTAALPFSQLPQCLPRARCPWKDWRLVSSGDSDWVIGNSVPGVSRELGLRDRGWYHLEALIKQQLSVYFGECSLFTWRSVSYD